MTNEQPERIATGSPKDRFSEATIAKLDAPLNPGRVAVDPRGNPYLEGWDVIAAANAYFGFDGWNSEVLSVGIAYSTVVERTRDNRTFGVEVSIYQARVAIEAGGVRKVDIGSSITSNDSPEAHETAAKGAVTDGLKRALRQFGAQFGNDLYDKGRTGGGYVEAPQQERQQEQPAKAPAVDVLTWAWTTHRMSKTDVFRVCGVTTVDDLNALGGEAQTMIENQMATSAR